MNPPLDFGSIWARVARLSLRRFQWFAYVAQQHRMRSTEIMQTTTPTRTRRLGFRADAPEINRHTAAETPGSQRVSKGPAFDAAFSRRRFTMASKSGRTQRCRGSP